MNATEGPSAPQPPVQPVREQWLWLGSWGPSRQYGTGSRTHGTPVTRDGGHVYACVYEHFSTEYDRPSTGCSFWRHVPEFCCQIKEAELRG